MKLHPTRLDGVLIIEPKLFTDPRGYFFEAYHEERYRHLGISCRFVQDNLSFSVKNTLRGLHYQHPHGQDKLVSVLRGEVLDVAVDIRRGSPSFGQWASARLSEHNRHQLFIPKGFAHGFCVLSDEAVFSYKCSEFYAPASEHGIAWNDPEIGIEWPLGAPLLSEKDGSFPRLGQVPEADLPVYDAREQ